MCLLGKPAKKDAYIGWKVVGVNKKGTYFSVATGMPYVSGRKIKPPKASTNPFKIYSDNLIRKSCRWYNNGMVGRTCIFRLKRDADDLCSTMATTAIFSDYEIKVVKAKVELDCLYGVLDGITPVVGGRIITFLE